MWLFQVGASSDFHDYDNIPLFQTPIHKNVYHSPWHQTPYTCIYTCSDTVHNSQRDPPVSVALTLIYWEVTYWDGTLTKTNLHGFITIILT